MKKYMNRLFLSLLAMTAMTACKEDPGTTPGGDSTPNAVVYQYTAGDGYNADNDCFLRVTTNSATESVYYLAELTSAYEARKQSGEALAEYVVANGQKIEGLGANASKDFYVTDLHGYYTISVAAVSGGSKTVKSTTFAGLDYKTIGTGTYSPYFTAATGSVDADGNAIGDTEVKVEYSEVGDRYRITGAWTDGVQFSFSPSSGAVYPSSIVTGALHPKYGAVSATAGTVSQEDDKTFVFTFTWRVSAGSFGQYDDVLYLD